MSSSWGVYQTSSVTRAQELQCETPLINRTTHVFIQNSERIDHAAGEDT